MKLIFLMIVIWLILYSLYEVIMIIYEKRKIKRFKEWDKTRIHKNVNQSRATYYNYYFNNNE